MHPLLRQQIRQHLATDGIVPPELQSFISAVDDAYRQASRDRRKKEKFSAHCRELEEAQSSLQRAVGVVGHELRSPICAIRSITELLLMTPPELLPSQGAMFLPGMMKELTFMSDLVSDILENARLHSGAERWNWGTLRPADVVEEAMRSLVLAGEPDSPVLLHSDTTDAPETMLGDASAIRRLIVNLMANARRHTESGGINIRVAACLEPEWMAIVITDTGSGIPPATLARLGRPFATNTGVTRRRVAARDWGCRSAKGSWPHMGAGYLSNPNWITARPSARCCAPI